MSTTLFRKFDTFPDRFVKWGFCAYFLAKILKVLLVIPFVFFWVFWLIFYDEYLEYQEKRVKCRRAKIRMIFPKCDDRAVCCTNPDIGGLVTPQDCIVCKKKQAKEKQIRIEK